MEQNPTQQPQSSVWPLIRAQVIEKHGEEPILRELPDGSMMHATVASAFEQCVELDHIGNSNPELVLRIIQEGIAKAREL